MKHIAYLLFTIILLAACGQKQVEPTAETGQKVDTTVYWLEYLNEVDSNLLADETMNPEKGWKAFGAFRAFARQNPDHKLAPTYHMKAAAIARNIPGKALMAVEEYMTVYKQYPNDTLAPQAQFLVGFTFDEALNDVERSTKAYQGFIQKYPNHPLAAQAQARIATMQTGETDLEMVKKWQKQQQQNN